MVADTHDELPESKNKIATYRRWHDKIKDREGNKILIDKKGNIVGAKMNQYLLEKSRIVPRPRRHLARPAHILPATRARPRPTAPPATPPAGHVRRGRAELPLVLPHRRRHRQGRAGAPRRRRRANQVPLPQPVVGDGDAPDAG